MSAYVSKKIIVQLLIFWGGVNFCNAQNKPVKKPVAIQKPLTDSMHSDSIKFVFKSFWGNRAGGEISVEEGLALIDSSLIVKDQFGNNYTVVRFRFMYRQLGAKEDERTGDIIPVHDMVAKDFYEVQSLPELWRNVIKESLKANEEWIIDTIIFKNKKGNKLLAPDLNFKIK